MSLRMETRASAENDGSAKDKHDAEEGRVRHEVSSHLRDLPRPEHLLNATSALLGSAGTSSPLLSTRNHDEPKVEIHHGSWNLTRDFLSGSLRAAADCSSGPAAPGVVRASKPSEASCRQSITTAFDGSKSSLSSTSTKSRAKDQALNRSSPRGAFWLQSLRSTQFEVKRYLYENREQQVLSRASNAELDSHLPLSERNALPHRKVALSSDEPNEFQQQPIIRSRSDQRDDMLEEEVDLRLATHRTRSKMKDLLPLPQDPSIGPFPTSPSGHSASLDSSSSSLTGKSGQENLNKSKVFTDECGPIIINSNSDEHHVGMDIEGLLADKAATVIQSTWRMYIAQTNYKHRLLAFTVYGMRYFCAATIQRHWRGYHTRKVLKEEATCLVIKYPVCLCPESLESRRKKGIHANSIFGSSNESQDSAKFVHVEVNAFESWLPETKKARQSMSIDRREGTLPKNPRNDLASSRSIIPLLRSRGAFQFYNRIIEVPSLATPTWSHTYVRPNVPDECTLVRNTSPGRSPTTLYPSTHIDAFVPLARQTSMDFQPSSVSHVTNQGPGHEGTTGNMRGQSSEPHAGGFLGNCMRRPKCFFCDRRIRELNFEVAGSACHRRYGLDGTMTAPSWKTTDLQVSGTFDALPWINFHKLSYCPLRRCLVFSVPKASLIPAHSASRHLVSTASNTTRSSGNNELLRAAYDESIQCLLDAMLKVVIQRYDWAASYRDRSALRSRRASPGLARDLGTGMSQGGDRPNSLYLNMEGALMHRRELKEYLEVYINNRFGNKSLLAIEFKFVDTKPNNSLFSTGGDEPNKFEWFLNEDEYPIATDTQGHRNNHLMLVV